MTVAIFSSALPGSAVEHVVAAAASVGVDAVEWGAGPGQAVTGKVDARSAAKRCRALGLSVCGVSVQDRSATLGAPASAERYLALAAALEAPWIRFFPTTYSGGLARAQARARAALDRLVERAAPLGIRVLVENSPGTIAPTAELVLDLVAHHGHDRTGVLWDPGNAAMEGWVGPRLAVEQLGPYLAHVHLKNVSWRRRSGAWQLGYARLDDGIVDWRAVLQALADNGYGGAFAHDHLRGAGTLAELRTELVTFRPLLAASRLSPG